MRTVIKNLILTIACLTYAQVSLAETITWVNPTQRENGVALAPSEIGSTFVEWGTCVSGNVGTVKGSQTASGAITSMVTPAYPIGTSCTRAFTTTTTGARSAQSVVVSTTVVESPPKPPTLFTVTTTAYERRGFLWFASMRKVGTVGIMEQCGATWSKDKTYGTLNRNQVTITRRYRGGQLYGRCV